MNYGPLPMTLVKFAVGQATPLPPSEVEALTQQSYWAPDNNDFLRTVPTLGGGTEDPAVVTTIPTFNSVGFRWPTTAGGNGIVCQCVYRPVGQALWLEALPLWWDDRAVYGEEYRGSIMFLKDDQDYEALLELSTGEFRLVEWTTWPEHFPEGDVTTVMDRSTTLSLGTGDSGTAGAWKVWTSASGLPDTTIDVERGEDYCVSLDGVQYVILRGLIN